MRLVSAIAAISFFALPSLAEAQHYHRHHGYSSPPRHYVPPRHHRPQHHHHHRHRNWNNDALAAGIGLGLLGGLIGGVIINQQPSYGYPQYNRPCYREVIGYDPVTGHTIARTICP